MIWGAICVAITHLALGDTAVILNWRLSNFCQGLVSWAFPVKFPSCEYHKTSLMTSQHWLRWRLVTSGQCWPKSVWPYGVTRPQWVKSLIYILPSPSLRWWIYAMVFHDDVIKWKNCLRYWPLVRWIHRSPVNSPHQSQWRGALMFSLICAWINGWAGNREAIDLRRHGAHYDVIVMLYDYINSTCAWYINHTVHSLIRHRNLVTIYIVLIMYAA